MSLARRVWTNEPFRWCSFVVIVPAPANSNVTNAMRRPPSVWYLPTTMPKFFVMAHAGPFYWQFVCSAFEHATYPPFFVFLNSLTNVSLETAPTLRTPRCSRTRLWAIISRMRVPHCFRFTFPLLWRRIGWCTSSAILLSGGVSRCPHNKSRPAVELGLSTFP